MYSLAEGARPIASSQKSCAPGARRSDHERIPATGRPSAMTSRAAMPLLLGCIMTLTASAAVQAAGPSCLYQSRSYSEGAYICVQRSLMQTCASDGAWRVVIDKELSGRCLAPLTFAQPGPRGG